MKNLLILIFLFIFTISFSNTIIYEFKAYSFNDTWVDEKTLKDLSFSFVKNEKIFMAYGNDLFVGKNGNITINFEQTYENVYKIENDVLFLDVSFLAQYLKLKKLELENGSVIYYDFLPELIRIDFQNNNLKLFFTSEITSDFFEFKILNNDLIVYVLPVQGSPVVLGKIDFERKSNGFIFYILSNVLKPTPILTFQNKMANIEIKYSYSESKEIKNGVVWERKIEEFSNQKFLVNYLHIDPKKADIIPLISSKGIGTREDLRQMIKNANCIAGINANYFDPSTNLPIDLVIKDGKVLSDKFGLRPAFIITYNDDVFIKRILVELNVFLEDILFLVKGVNTNAKGEVLLYSEEYSLTIPYDSDKIYFLIQNNQIVDKDYYKKVPENSLILAISRKYDKYLQNIDIGSKVSFSLNTNFPYPIKHAVAAGPFLIENGKIIEDAASEKQSYGNGIAYSKTTRTIIAITQDNKVDFIIIEGYNNNPGMNYDMAVDFLLQKGYYAAMMLDGGGSSAMVIEHNVVNQDGEIQRGIPVGLGIK